MKLRNALPLFQGIFLISNGQPWFGVGNIDLAFLSPSSQVSNNDYFLIESSRNFKGTTFIIIIGLKYTLGPLFRHR